MKTTTQARHSTPSVVVAASRRRSRAGKEMHYSLLKLLRSRALLNQTGLVAWRVGFHLNKRRWPWLREYRLRASACRAMMMRCYEKEVLLL